MNGKSSKSSLAGNMLRRSRSAPRKKQLSPSPPRRHGPIQRKRPPSHDKYNDERHIPKRPRSSPRHRRRTPSRHSPRRGHQSYSGSRDIPSDKPRDSEQFIVKDNVSSRLRSKERYIVDRPLARGPDKDVTMDRDSLKKIVVKMRDAPPGNDSIKRDIVNPEDINVVRRAGEGSRPIFDRDEIVNYGRKFEESSERERKRIVSRSPVHSSRTHASNERFRARESHYDERNESIREYSRGRPSRECDSRGYDRSRDERPRYPPSRDYSPERSDTYEERKEHRSFRRSPGRPVGRSRRRPSPRRRFDDYRAHVRERSPERRERSPEMREEISPNRGRGRGFSPRGRGLSATRLFPRPGEIIMHPGPPVRPVRGAFLPRLPGRRLPFPPRLVRPLVGPLIRVIAPVIPVRPPVLPVRPPVIPVRHPVVPLPY